MDGFVQTKLTEWGLSDWIKTFQDQSVDEESFYRLNKDDIKDLIPIIGQRIKFQMALESLKAEKNATNQDHEETDDSVQVLANSNRSDKGKRKIETQGESSGCLPPPREKQRQDITYAERNILSEVRTIMGRVRKKINKKINEKNTELNDFLKKKIRDLETEKKELVGVFGRTGAGKSSLINAVIEEKDLLPSSSQSVSACTTVIIKVEANKQNQKYEAEIEFITKEELRHELWYLLTFILKDEDRNKGDADYRDAVEMMSALYGEEWKKNPSEEYLTDDKNFPEIGELIKSGKKSLSCEKAEDLAAELLKYTRGQSKHWPLVKCVTVRVPDSEHLQNVTLVDLPGNGDRNKGRDKMWKKVVQSCSTVWIVADIKRAASEKEPWEILQSASSLMGNGGQRQHIHFICTMSDVIGNSDDLSEDGVRAAIFNRNMRAKDEVMKEFMNQMEVQTQFSGDCFKVFTVSSKEFLKEKTLRPEETEIPQLLEFLQELNDFQSDTRKYVSGAYGILSLIQGAGCREAADINVCTDLKKNLTRESRKVSAAIEVSCVAFDKCLMEGVKKSKILSDSDIDSFVNPDGTSGRTFHGTLKCLMGKNGVHKPKDGKQLNLNEKLASKLTESIDEEFRKTFPNESKCDPFNGAISSFSLGTKTLAEKYKGVQLQLEFLRTEEENIKTKLQKTIRERKKEIYCSLMTSIEENMQKCYDDAQKCSSDGYLKTTMNIIKKHVHAKKDVMFEEAKEEMMSKLQNLKDEIMKTLDETMQKSIELSLISDGESLPDVKKELETVTKYYNELKTVTDVETSQVSADQPGPSAAQKGQLRETGNRRRELEDDMQQRAESDSVPTASAEEYNLCT